MFQIFNKTYPVFVTISGLFLIITGFIFSWFVTPAIQKYLISKNLQLVDGNPIYEIWKKQPFPVKFKIYIFNVTNPDEVTQGELPKIKEVGPYVYDEYRTKNVNSINETADTINFTLIRNFVYNRRESFCQSDEELVTVINPSLITTALRAESMGAMAIALINAALPHLFPNLKSPFLTARVKDFLFDGVVMSCEDEEADGVCEILRDKLPKTIRSAPNDRDFLVSLFHHLNNTPLGPYVMERGLTDTIRGELVAVDTQYNLNIWGGAYCNAINGTDLTLISPISDPPKKINFFAVDLCRSLHANFISDLKLRDQTMYRFEINQPLDGDPALQECFCINATKKSNPLPKCGPKGTLEMSPCMEAPILASFPHFYMADESLLNFVPGLNPVKDLHGSFLIVEPKTSTPISVKVRVQTNIPLKKIDGIDVMQNVSEGIFPIMWIEQGGDIPDKLFDQLIENLIKLSKIDLIKWVLVVIGGGIMGFGFIFSLIKEKIFDNPKRDRAMFASKVSAHAPQPVLNVKDFNSLKLYNLDIPHLD